MATQNKSIPAKEWKTLEISVPIEEGLEVKYENSSLKVKGPKGEVEKQLKFPRVYVKVDGSNVVVGTKHFTQREKKIIHTYRAHIKNLMLGAKEGFEYKLKVVFAKFPITAGVSGNKFELKNLLGEKVPRIAPIPEGVKVEVKGQDITVTGIDKEKTGQMAASLEQLTKVTNLDRRVVQDGIFITNKPHRDYI